MKIKYIKACVLKISVLALIILSSCVQTKKMVYLKDSGKENVESYQLKGDNEGIIQPFDEIYFRVTSFDEQQYNFFANNTGGMMLNSGNDITLLSYSVNSEGDIKLPIIGNYHIAGMNLKEAGEKIQEMLSGYLNQPSVILKFVNKKVTILGEVRVPGSYNFSKENLTIFQALGMAGDVTSYGNRKKVYLLRQDGHTLNRIEVDLTSSDIITKEYFIIKDDDIIMVEPLRRRVWGTETIANIFTIFSGLSTVTSLIILIINFDNNIR